MFPKDSLNFRTDITGNVSAQNLISVPSGQTYTILYESYNSNSTDASAHLYIDCGSTRTLAVNSFKEVPAIERFKMAKCTANITATISGTTGSPDDTINIIYVPYDIAKTLPPGYYDSLFVASIIVFLLAFQTMPGIFSFIRELFKPK